MSSEPIQVGMIGLGGMGSEHFNKVCANRQFAIAALCSIDNEDSRRRMQERFPAAQRPLVTDNYRDVLDDDRIEAGGPCEGIVQVHGVVVARQPGENLGALFGRSPGRCRHGHSPQ